MHLHAVSDVLDIRDRYGEEQLDISNEFGEEDTRQTDTLLWYVVFVYSDNKTCYKYGGKN